MDGGGCCLHGVHEFVEELEEVVLVVLDVWLAGLLLAKFLQDRGCVGKSLLGSLLPPFRLCERFRSL